MTTRFSMTLLAACAALSLAACGRPFDVKTAPGFVELENQKDYGYSYRATSPEGVVMGIRVVDDEKRGDLTFWTKAVTLQLRETAGYALVAEGDTVSLDGTKGRRLRFGRDEDGKPFVYDVSLYVAQDRLFVVEAGGTKEQMDRAQASIEWMNKSVRVKCDTFVSPVLASKTCNRW